MKIGIMRRMDYWLGLPICFLLSVFNFFAKFFIPPKKEKPPRKILLVKLSELGAVILAYPFFSRVKKECPSAQIFFLSFQKNSELFRLLRLSSEINILTIRDDSLGLFILDTLRAIKRLRRERLDIAFDLDFFSRFTAILAFLSGAGKRAGFYRYTFEGLYRGALLTHKFQYNPLAHISRNYLAFAQALGLEKKDTPEINKNIADNEIILPRYVSDNKIREAMRAKLKASGVSDKAKLFLINPGEGLLPLREWPLKNFIALSKRILEDKDNHIVIVGKDRAFYKGQAILEAVGASRCLNYSDKTSLEEMVELFNLAEALISNDCGLAHLAMLSPVKKFVLFGPESPQVFGPLGENNWVFYSKWPCSPCLSVLNHRDSSCRENKCLKAISPEDVYGLIQQALK